MLAVAKAEEGAMVRETVGQVEYAHTSERTGRHNQQQVARANEEEDAWLAGVIVAITRVGKYIDTR